MFSAWTSFSHVTSVNIIMKSVIYLGSVRVNQCKSLLKFDEEMCFVLLDGTVATDVL